MSRTLKVDIPGPDWRVSFAELEKNGPSDLFGAGTRPPLVLDVTLPALGYPSVVQCTRSKTN